MIINAASQNSFNGIIHIGTRNSGVINPPASGLSIKSAQSSQTQPVSEAKNALYGNFEKEMSRRLNEAMKKNHNTENDEVADSATLIQSLTGAMGEIEQIFGRDAATGVMAKIITATASEVTKKSLLTSIQNGLSGLKRLDPNNAKMKQLTDCFNKDLSLALDQDLANKKLESKQTVSLSYAISKHFGTMSPLTSSQMSSIEAADESQNNNSISESYQMHGFNETGGWDTVEVAKPDTSSSEEIRAAAEAGISKATELTMTTIMDQENGSKIFDDLSAFLKKNLQDKESFLFVEQCITDSYFGPESSSPKMTQLLSQVYSKVAADGDADKLAIFENYINNDFKDALNPILAAMQQGDGALLPGAEAGDLQFKGITGVSLAGENDIFSLNWGYKDDSRYDRSISKRFLHEDIRGVKAAKEKIDAIEQGKLIKAWDDTAEEKRIEEGKNKNSTEENDIRTTFAERFSEENRQKKLEEVMTTKFGQLSDRSREELDKYIAENFDEENAEKLLEHTKWSNDLMTGLASLHRDISESGADENKIKGYVNFLNGTIKKEVVKITAELGGVSFEGWQSLEGISGGLEASVKFPGQDATKIATMGFEDTLQQENTEPLTADQILNAPLSSRQEEEVKDDMGSMMKQLQDEKVQDNQSTMTGMPGKLLKLSTGYLIDLMA